MLQTMNLLFLYSLYLFIINVLNGFIPNQVILYVQNRNIELDKIEHEIPDTYYYFQDENGTIVLRSPIFMPINE